MKKELRHFGLLGKNISYSFSAGYFTEKFKQLDLDNHSYVNFDLQNIEEIKNVLAQDKDIVGFNITIPYKEAIIPFLTEIDPKAKEIGAVNTVKITKNGLKGYNTDIYGFYKSIEPFIKSHHKKALILGTGGASKAVKHALIDLGLEIQFVSRTASENKLSYEMLTKQVMEQHQVIVNCSPIGTFPNTEAKPAIPYEFLTEGHLVFDLIYNPPKTAFMKYAEANGATAVNGSKMLELQAEKAWEIWNG
ncbi:shikimate 5-dehydrogenase [Galbibacter orientalis DSM 19592]|uniref:Shikimate 5-dehydrogenase n=1 Tax=Galbibacter orientalis DSM 19592 TaxID=926559 RepID=I3C6H2_9FLAO|nr:shikimate dehydrogenase [Galbibacter orientalis]EIJ39215.1 shikimate 5-dehydrogenase [Galbibacter orientalis DSM 19592]